MLPPSSADKTINPNAPAAAASDEARAVTKDGFLRPSFSQEHNQCSACLYTGVSLCCAMTTYFAHQAYDPALIAKSRYNKPVFFAVAGAWAVAGIYRYSLG